MYWVHDTVLYAIHDYQIAEHGGADGIRDSALIESAMNRPKQKALYGEEDLCVLAAAYAYGITRNHGFVDGNKRTAWVVARLFLRDNEVQMTFDPADAVLIMEKVAAGTLSEEQLAAWFQQRLV